MSILMTVFVRAPFALGYAALFIKPVLRMKLLRALQTSINAKHHLAIDTQQVSLGTTNHVLVHSAHYSLCDMRRNVSSFLSTIANKFSGFGSSHSRIGELYFGSWGSFHVHAI